MSCLETTIFKSGCLSYRVLLLVDLYAASNCPNTFSFFHISSVLLYPPCCLFLFHINYFYLESHWSELVVLVSFFPFAFNFFFISLAIIFYQAFCQSQFLCTTESFLFGQCVSAISEDLPGRQLLFLSPAILTRESGTARLIRHSREDLPRN